MCTYGTNRNPHTEYLGFKSCGRETSDNTSQWDTDSRLWASTLHFPATYSIYTLVLIGLYLLQKDVN